VAFSIYKGPNGSITEPTTGDWFAVANWSKGAPPDSSTDAVLGAGSYTVTLNGDAAAARSLNIGAGATLTMAGNTTSLSLGAGPSLNAGTFVVTGAYLGLGGDLLNTGTFYGDQLTGYTATIVGDHTIVNDGLISSALGATNPAAYFTTAIDNEADGVVATRGGGALYLVGALTNDGLVAAVANGLITTSAFGQTGAVTNVQSTVLNGGEWLVEGGSQLWLAVGGISMLGDGAVVTLDGDDAIFRVDDGNPDPIYLEQSLDTVEEGATLNIIGGRDYRTDLAFFVDGAMTLAGGTFDAASLRVGATGILTGGGVIDAQTIADGAIRTEAGKTLTFTDSSDFNGPIAGRGTLELSGGSDTFTTGRVTVKTLLLDGADVQLDRNLDYGGKLVMTAGTLDVTDRTLTLSGTAVLGDATIHADARGKLAIEGALAERGGHALIDVGSVTVNGTVGISGGSLAFTGVVGGTGTISVGSAGTLILQDAGRLTSAPLVSLDGRGATIDFDNLRTDGVRIANFDGNDSIVFSAFRARGATFAFNADADGTGGTLVLTNGAQVASVHLEENHTARDFTLAKAADGGTVVLARGSGFAAVDHAAFGADTEHASFVAPASHDPHLLALVLA
jgi:hypothetical protein